MKKNGSPEKLYPVRSWYGLSAEIGVEGGLWHLVRIGGFALRHPPVVNRILRRGLPEQERLKLSLLHEFGHLQTLPVPIIHIILLAVYGKRRKQNWYAALKTFFAATIAHQAVWELASESYAIAKTGSEEYRHIYKKHPNPAGQVLFWGGMLSLAVFFTIRTIRQQPEDTP